MMIASQPKIRKVRLRDRRGDRFAWFVAIALGSTIDADFPERSPLHFDPYTHETDERSLIRIGQQPIWVRL